MTYDMYLVEQSMLAMLNAAVCVVAMVILLCRLNAMNSSSSERVRTSVRIAHMLGVGAMTYSIISFAVDDWPSGARIAVMVYIVAELWASRHAWRGQHGDEPPESATTPAELREH